ncbi:hypothetical protein PAXRUDRAFT_833659 [Paxillus rubicundulus Ve08.2h10]|uniref:Unplaced genomic scaffold scaffold_1247, whole genome shotgun sequence n=1 Tax=Paxillus rubicundulus Ve08.2h10 TaxID=930991 RepID=A0A0D0DG83_9AGAM|nr:hypothetical protein PAXRUDRAFT_833659 [Paxillus rubicundulus Ve08.2h10]
MKPRPVPIATRARCAEIWARSEDHQHWHPKRPGWGFFSNICRQHTIVVQQCYRSYLSSPSSWDCWNETK